MHNPSAFPIPNDDRPGSYEAAPGMDLRDYFAGQALVGMGMWTPGSAMAVMEHPQNLRARANWAYAQADAMLAARQEGSSDDQP